MRSQSYRMFASGWHYVALTGTVFAWQNACITLWAETVIIRGFRGEGTFRVLCVEVQ